MSFILDALKKSELERQRQSIPGLVESGVARPRQRLPLWAIAVCVLLGINLIVLLVVLLRGWMAPDTARQTSAAPLQAQTRSLAPGRDAASAAAGAAANAEAGAARGAATAPQATTEEPVYAPEIPLTSGGGTSDSSPPAAANPPSTAGAASSGTHAIRRRDPLLTSEDYKADEDEVLPSINEIHLTGSQALPELHLDVHVFATRPAERFVFINMRKYHEGATLSEGPTIERIRRDGVILDYQGVRFLLPRQ